MKNMNVLARSDVLGSFDFFTTIVSLESLTSGDLSAQVVASMLKSNSRPGKLTDEQYKSISKVFPLVFHEYAHFFDATSTLWGIKHLNLMNSAYCSDDRRQGDERRFFRAKEFLDHVRTIHLPEYYSVVTTASAVRPWRADTSIGQLFNSTGHLSGRRVLFQRFHNAVGNLLARSPISSLSLLECSAMAQQILLQADLVDRLDSDFGIVERRDFATRTLDYLYNKDLTEYSVCVHLVANKLRCRDGVASFAASALIVRIVLNLPAAIFEKLCEAADLMDRIGLPKDAGHAEFEEALRDGLKHLDLGTMFYLLACCLPEAPDLVPSRAAVVVEQANKQLGIDVQETHELALSEARTMAAEVGNSPVNSLAKLAPLAFHNLSSINYKIPLLDFNSFHLPPALLGDSVQIQLVGNSQSPLTGTDLDEIFNELYEGQRWVERFSEACI